MSEWVRDWERGVEYAEHLNGVEWFDAPTPRRLHRCRPQTRGVVRGSFVERCACGATRLGGRGPWMERNQNTARRWRARTDRSGSQ